MNSMRKVVLRICLFGLLLFGAAEASPRDWIAVPSGDTPQVNPMKGFVPYDGNYQTFPYSMEFFYLPAKAVQTGYETFDWTILENKLSAISSRRHQAIVRLYYDYPDEVSGIPAFLSHVPTRSYTAHDNGVHHTSVSPDYEHVDLRRSMFSLIAAFGQRYDGDPRIAFVKLGLVGFWGEWHTWPHPEWMPTLDTQNEVMQAYLQAFPNTPLLVREPRGISNTLPLGYHDDSFVYNTYGAVSWYHYAKLQSAGETMKWRTVPMGGELRPEIQESIWDTDALEETSPEGFVQNWWESVALTRPSWMLVARAFWPGLHELPRTRALAASQALGYNLRVDSWTYAHSATGCHIQVRIGNVGVAPFYRPWIVELGFFQGGQLRYKIETAWDIRSVIDPEPLTFEHEGPLAILPGIYEAGICVRNPMENGLPLLFSNVNAVSPSAEWQMLGSFVHNHPPELGPVGNRSVQVGQPLQIVVEASDADSEVLGFSATGSPP